MFNLIKADLYKMRKTKSIKILFLLCCISATLMSVISYQLTNGNLSHDIIGIGSFFTDFQMISLVSVIFISLFICNDFDNKTIHDSISTGYSRSSIIICKTITYFISILIFLLPDVIAAIVGMCSNYSFETFLPSVFQNIMKNENGTAFDFNIFLKIIAIWFTMAIVYASQISISIFLAFSIDGGVGEIVTTLFNEKFLAKNEVIFDPNILNTSVFIIMVGAGINTFSSYISSQDVVQRFTTTTDIKQLNKMTYGNGILSIGTATVLYLLGTSLFVFYNQNPNLLQTAQQDQIFAFYIVYQLPVGVSGLVLAAIYAAAQSTLSTGLNSVATSWTLDIQSVITKDMSMEKQTKIAKFISLGVGVVAIVVSIVMANGEIKSAYEWFNSFMGLVLGVLAGIFVLGVFSKNATNIGAYVGFIVSAMVVINLKYNHPEVTSWSYSIITIVTSFIVGNIVSYLYIKVKNVSVNKEETIHPKDIA